MARLAWAQTIDKKVFSADEKELGKVQSISTEYIETKGGIPAKHYFIPKYYIDGYDADGNIWISLDEQDAKRSFEGRPPASKELIAQSYLERKRAMLAVYPDFDTYLPPYQTAGTAVTTRDTMRTVRSNAETSAEETVIPWGRIVKKQVRTSNGNEIGKVKAISPDFIEVEEGRGIKKQYYIPKYYVEGFDGDHVYLVPEFASKEEITDRFRRDRPPTEAEFKTPEYLQRKREVEARYPQFLHGVPWMAREPYTEIPVDYSGTAYNIPWDKLIHQHVRGSDNTEIGYVERIGDEFVVVRPGTGTGGDVYYVPKTYIRDYDGSQLWLDAPSDLVATRFRLESEPSREELRSLAREAPRVRKQSGTTGEASTATRGPAVLWGELKGKEVKTNDGKTIGEIKEISRNYVRIEKGTIRKQNKFWVPKFMFDIYDGNSVRLMTSEEETMQHLKSQEPSASEEYMTEFERFRAVRPSYVRDITSYEEGVRSSEGYKNIRDLD
jgi:hypothetical protein